MHRVISSKTKLLLCFWAMLLIALAVSSRYYYHNLRREIVSQTENGAIQRLHTVHWLLSQQDFQNRQELQQWLVALGKQMGMRITYMAAGGQVIADSEVPFADISKMDNHASRPEIVQARREGLGTAVRFSRTSQKRLIYTAENFAGKGHIPAGVLSLARPWSPIKKRYDELSINFLVLIAALFLPIALLSYVLARQLDKPVRSMIQATEAITERNFRERLRFHPGQEFYVLAQAINNMAEHIDTDMQTIADQKEQLEAVFNGMREGVMVLDPAGRIRSINRAMANIIPKVQKPFQRKPLEVTMNLELQEACDSVLSSHDDPENYHRSLQIDLGEERIYDVAIIKLQTEQRQAGAIVVFHDISQLKRLERVRQDFVANVSHELRTPLTSVKGYAETLLAETGTDPATHASFLGIILKNTNHMVKMVDDLLQLARLERQQKPLHPDQTNAGEALLAAWKACAPLAEAEQVNLQNELPEEGVIVAVDQYQLVQVFRNLLENAVKYSPAGESIRVFCREQDHMVIFAVQDTGPGIPKQHQQRIFERFYRVEKHRGHRAGSTGLGLAICRHIVENHQGRIWVESPNELGSQGATFFFTLEPVQPNGEDHTAAAARSEPA